MRRKEVTTMMKMTKTFKHTEHTQTIAFVNYVAKHYKMKTRNEFYGVVVEVEYNPHHGEQTALEVAYAMAMAGTL